MIRLTDNASASSCSSGSRSPGAQQTQLDREADATPYGVEGGQPGDPGDRGVGQRGGGVPLDRPSPTLWHSLSVRILGRYLFILIGILI